MGGSFTILEHTADIGFEARGGTPGELFETAAAALYAIAAEPATIAARDQREVTVHGTDYPDLLVNFLSELLYLFDANLFAAARVEVTRIDPAALDVRLSGEPRDPSRHRWRLIVKAVTYHGLEVTARDGEWVARVFLDV